MIDCRICKHNYKPLSCEPKCNRMCDGKSDFEPISNADRIRSMSDEEMVEWIFKHDTKTICYGRLNREDLLKWLKHEVNLTT